MEEAKEVHKCLRTAAGIFTAIKVILCPCWQLCDMQVACCGEPLRVYSLHLIWACLSFMYFNYFLCFENVLLLLLPVFVLQTHVRELLGFVGTEIFCRLDSLFVDQLTMP